MKHHTDHTGEIVYNGTDKEIEIYLKVTSEMIKEELSDICKN